MEDSLLENSIGDETIPNTNTNYDISGNTEVTMESNPVLFKALEKIRCTKSPLYYIKKYGYVYDAQKNTIAKMNCYPYQEQCIRDFRKHRNNIVLKSRQAGISAIAAGFISWKLLFQSDQKILIIANARNGAVRFLKTVKEFCKNTPEWLKPDSVIKENTEEYVFSNNSQVQAVASGENAGRGEGLTMLVLDEGAFIKDIDDIWKAAALTLSMTKGQCLIISCVPKDTMVFTNNGIKEIGSFIKENNNIGGYEVEPYSVYGKDKLRQGNLFFNNGFHKTKIIISTNAEIEGTLTHKLWACKNGVYDWFKMEELNEGDYISVQYNMECWGKNDDISDFKPTQNNKIKNNFKSKKITKKIAYLIGLYIAEGSSYKVKGEKNEFIDRSITTTYGSKNFIEFLEYIGFNLSKKEKEKEIPSRLMEISRENIIYMLRGIFDGYGYSKKDIECIGICMSSKKLIKQIKMLLLNFGILTDYCEVLAKTTKSVKVYPIGYKITANHEFSKIFYNKIGFEFNRKHINKYKILSPSLKWDIIIKTKYSENETFDFSLPNSNDFWAHSVIYNGVVGHQTPNGIGNLYHKLWVGAINKDKNNGFYPTRIHWTQNPYCSEGLEIREGIDGKPEYWSPWYEEQCKNLQYDRVSIAQELDMSFEGSKPTALDADSIARYTKDISKDAPASYIRYDFLYKSDIEKFASFQQKETTFQVWKEPEPGRQYILAADVSRGDGGDYSTMEVFDVDTLEQCAEFRDKIAPNLFPYIINWTARKYNMAYVAIEANTFGLGVCYDMQDKFNYRKLHRCKNARDIFARSIDRKVEQGTEIPGWQTTRVTRPLIVTSLNEHMAENAVILHSHRLLSEMDTFIVKNDKPQAEQGYNDDLILATAIALYVRSKDMIKVKADTEFYKSMLDAMSLKTYGGDDKNKPMVLEPDHLMQQSYANYICPKCNTAPIFSVVITNMAINLNNQNFNQWSFGCKCRSEVAIKKGEARQLYLDNILPFDVGGIIINNTSNGFQSGKDLGGVDRDLSWLYDK